MPGADEIPVNARLAEKVQALDESEAPFLAMAEAATFRCLSCINAGPALATETREG